MNKKFEKWYNKIKKGEDGYEGVSFEHGHLVHSMELHKAELEIVKIKTFRKGNLIEEITLKKDELDVTTPLLKIFIKEYSELFLSTDAGKTKFYFGENTKYSNQSIDEILVYIEGNHGCFLLHGLENQSLQYLSNIGTGDASEFMLEMFESKFGKCEANE